MFLFLLLLTTARAQSGPRVQTSHTTENLRGISIVSAQVAWASGTHGTYLRTTDAGQTWTPAQVPDAATLDFRAVVAFSADEAFLMSAGPGDQSRIYHTTDAGQHWKLQFTNTNPKGFFDSMAFSDAKHGIVLGDPIPDQNGKLKFELLQTEDGESWHPIPPAQLPHALEGEGAFAASNSCIAILKKPVILSGAVTQAKRRQLRSRRIPTFAPMLNAASWATALSAARQSPQSEGASASAAPDDHIWFATGGKAARVFHSPDAGKTWDVHETPILHGPDSAGIFSIAFRDPQHGVIAGGDYKRPDDHGPNLAFTEDGGKTWTLSTLHPQAFFSSLAYDLQVNAMAIRQESEEKSAQASGKKIRIKPVPPQRLFIVGPNFIFDFRPPSNPRRINGKKKEGFEFNAAAPLPQGGALVVGPKGTIALIP
jgi:photosystem II stability/assembly factor-like uncharacterized protein